MNIYEINEQKIRYIFRHDFEDLTFKYTIMNYPEMIELITGYDDIIRFEPTEHINENYEKSIMDINFRRANNDLVNIEHHSTIREYLLVRDLDYAVIMYKKNEDVDQFLFYSGLDDSILELIKKVTHYHPKVVRTIDWNGTKILNNIKAKVNANKTISNKEMCLLIWLPKCRNNIPIEGIINELIKLIPKIKAEAGILQHLKWATIGWYIRYNYKNKSKNEQKEKVEELIEGLNMAMRSEELHALVAQAMADTEMMKDESTKLIFEKDKEIEKLTAERNKAVIDSNQKELSLQKKDKTIQEKDHKIEEKDKTIQEQYHELKEKNHKIEEKDHELKNAKQRIKELETLLTQTNTNPNIQ